MLQGVERWKPMGLNTDYEGREVRRSRRRLVRAGKSGPPAGRVKVGNFEELGKGASALLMAAGLLTVTAPGLAEAAPPFDGFYLAVGAGAVGLEDSQIDYEGARPSGGIGYDTGWAVSGAIGWRVLDLYRLELEASHRENDVWHVYSGSPPGGSVASTTYMANGYFDLPLLHYVGLAPYVGLGVGRAQFTHDIRANGATLADSSAHALAYQVIGGLEYPVIPGTISTTFEYRYLSSTHPTFRDQSGLYYHSDYESHTLMVGLRFTF